eukprot:s18_g25.t1
MIQTIGNQFFWVNYSVQENGQPHTLLVGVATDALANGRNLAESISKNGGTIERRRSDFLRGCLNACNMGLPEKSSFSEQKSSETILDHLKSQFRLLKSSLLKSISCTDQVLLFSAELHIVMPLLAEAWSPAPASGA